MTGVDKKAEGGREPTLRFQPKAKSSRQNVFGYCTKDVIFFGEKNNMISPEIL